MNYVINGREPQKVFNFFEQISEIPRGSGNEKGIADYLQKFAAERKLDCKRDAVNNVFIRIHGTEGREAEPSLLFQAHTDMVCEKNAGTEHDFLTDGIELYIDGKLLRAKGTTLGADDGIGVALMLALLDGAVKSHPPIECLFTVSEETGMDGVNNFDFSAVTAREMINLDSPEIDKAVVGCAGGVRCNLTIKADKLKNDKKSALKITLSGLAGGHSGENINHGRANANKLAGRLLLALKPTEYRLVTLDGGGKSNAIPRECDFLIVTDKPDEVRKITDRIAAEIRGELGDCDNGFFVRCETVDSPDLVFDKKTTDAAVALLGIVANGVLEMSKKIKGFVEYSRNLGVIVTTGDEIVFTFFARSAIDAQLDASSRELEALAKLCGASVEYSESYHGWNFETDSRLLRRYSENYRKVTGRDIIVETIHAGLECGIIKAIIPDMDIISVGPDAHDFHSPDESLDLDTVKTFFDIIVELLATSAD